MSGGDSTDYDSLPSPPIRATTSTRGGKTARRYGRKAARVAPPPQPPAQPQQASAARGGAARGRGARTERDASSGSGSDGRGERERGGIKRGKNAARSKSKAREVEEEADGESGAEEGGGEGRKMRVKEAKQRKRPAAELASRDPSPQPSQGAILSSAAAGPTSERPQKRPRTAIAPPPAQRSAAGVPPTPPRPPQQPKTHPAVLEAQSQAALSANMTPRSRARALGDKSNRPSLANASSRPSQARPSLPLSGGAAGSPRSQQRSTSRRGSLAPPPSPFGVFRDAALPGPSPASGRNPPSSIPPLPSRPILTDLPTRRRPLPRVVADASTSARPSGAPSAEALTSISIPRPLPRSPGARPSLTASPHPRPRLPRAATSFALPRSAPVSASPAAALLSVPGAPPPGVALRLPPPWSLAAPPTSSPAPLASAHSGAGAADGEAAGEEDRPPVFQFTTTQFADLPSLSFSSRPDAAAGVGNAARADESALVGMESSFMLETLEGEGSGSGMGWMGLEDETVTREELEEAVAGSEEGEETIRAVEGEQEAVVEPEEEGVDVVGDGRAEAQEESEDAMKEMDVDDAATFEDGSEAETTLLARDPPSLNAACPDAPSLPSSPPLSAPTAPVAKLLAPPTHNIPVYSSAFLPPRRPRPPIATALASGPPSDEDDLAYYLRTTGTFSSEDDLPLSSPLSDSSAEEDRLAELEVGRAMKPTSGQREKRIEASAEARREREARRAFKGLRIGEGKDGRRKGWRRVVLSPRQGRGRGGVEAGGEEGYEADLGEGEDQEEDELAMVVG